MTITTIILQILLFLMCAAYWIERWEEHKRIKVHRQHAVNEYQIKLIEKLEEIGADLYGFEKDLVFLVEMSNDEARINRYNGVVSERYVRLAKKVMTVWQRIDENVPDGQSEHGKKKMDAVNSELSKR